MSAPALSGLHVMIIDDEQDFAATLALRLELRGITVESFFSGEEGLARLREKLPDALLLDMRMPGFSGAAVLRELREGGGIPGSDRLPVFIVSGHSSEQDHEQVIALGIQGYICKPVQFDELLENIATVTGRAST